MGASQGTPTVHEDPCFLGATGWTEFVKCPN